MSAHTPGPWLIGPTDGFGQIGLLRVVDSEGHLIAFCEADKATATTFIRPFPIDKANACLIAAAPELLDVAQALLACDDEDDLGEFSNRVHHVMLKAHAAIAKTKGRTK